MGRHAWVRSYLHVADSRFAAKTAFRYSARPEAIRGDHAKLPDKAYCNWLLPFTIFYPYGFSPDWVHADDGSDRQADRHAIQAVLSAQQEAWNRGDVDAFLTGYWHSPELTFSGSSGIYRGWDSVLARYKKNYPDRAAMGQLEFSELEFHFLGPDAALVLGHWHLRREKENAKDDLGGVFSLVWQKLPQGWLIIHDHTSADAAK